MQRVLLANVAPTPWKNHRGTTQELLAWPSADDWRVRLSVASIEQSGEFSNFVGITRWFTVIDGQGVELAVGDQKARVDANSGPLCFDGGTPCRSQLVDGKVHAFNVMFAKGIQGKVARVEAGARVALDSGGFLAVYSIGHASCQLGDQALALESGELLWMARVPTAATSLTLHQGRCLVVTGDLAQ